MPSPHLVPDSMGNLVEPAYFRPSVPQPPQSQDLRSPHRALSSVRSLMLSYPSTLTLLELVPLSFYWTYTLWEYITEHCWVPGV